MLPNELIIIGGGWSISDGIKLGLEEKLKDKFVIACNLSIVPFPNSTFLSFIDRDDFYYKHKDKIKDLPLIVGANNKGMKTYSNTYLLTRSNVFDRTCLTGVYARNLCGIFALSLGIKLIDTGTIFLLGFDFGTTKKGVTDGNGKKLTHFYQGREDLDHKGIGKVDYYEDRQREENNFFIYKKENLIKIWNVSPLSNLKTFDKIDYPSMFEKLSKDTYNQEDLRKSVIDKITTLSHCVKPSK